MQIHNVENAGGAMVRELVCNLSKPIKRSARPPKAQIDSENSLLKVYPTTTKINPQLNYGLSTNTASNMIAGLYLQCILDLVPVFLEGWIVFLDNLLKLLLCTTLHVLSLHILRQEDKSGLGILRRFEEYLKVGDDTIMMENLGPEDSDVAKTDDAEMAKKAEDTTPEKVTEVASEKATNEMAGDITPKKVSANIAEVKV